MGFRQPLASIIREDNKSAIDIASSKRSFAGVKHIEIRHHAIQDFVSDKIIALLQIPTAEIVEVFWRKP